MKHIEIKLKISENYICCTFLKNMEYLHKLRKMLAYHNIFWAKLEDPHWTSPKDDDFDGKTAKKATSEVMLCNSIFLGVQ